MLKKLFMLGLTAVSAFALHTAELNINDKDLEVGAQFDLGQFNPYVEPNTKFLDFRFLKADKGHLDGNISKINPYLEAGFLMMQNLSRSNLRLGLGIKGNWTTDYATVPLGLVGQYAILSRSYVPMYFNVQVYYAPKVLSFRDAEDFLELRGTFDIEILKDGLITVGARQLETNYVNNQNIRYNRSIYFGFKIKF